MYINIPAHLNNETQFQRLMICSQSPNTPTLQPGFCMSQKAKATLDRFTVTSGPCQAPMMANRSRTHCSTEVAFAAHLLFIRHKKKCNCTKLNAWLTTYCFWEYLFGIRVAIINTETVAFHSTVPWRTSGRWALAACVRVNRWGAAVRAGGWVVDHTLALC